MKRYYSCFLLALVLIISLEIPRIQKKGEENKKAACKEELDYFRTMQVEEKKWEKRIKRSPYRGKYEQIRNDICSFPISEKDIENITFENGWMSSRSYGGDRTHEGCDLLDKNNKRGAIPVLSMTAGKVEKIGWLNLGGYRIGIRSSSGIYYYYAHLDSYSPMLKKGEKVSPGQFLGYMGDSGYGKEGTKGKFPVHLHLGIYIRDKKGNEYSVNPYYLLKMQKSPKKSKKSIKKQEKV